MRTPILTNAPAGGADIQIARAINKLTPKISRGDLARVMILASQQTAASRKAFDLSAAKGVAPSDEQLLKQLEEVPADSELR